MSTPFPNIGPSALGVPMAMSNQPQPEVQASSQATETAETTQAPEEKPVNSPAPEAPVHLPYPQDTFAPFIAKSSQIPTKGQFYWSELKTNWRRTMKEGNEHYKAALKEDEHTQVKAVLLALATGAGLTIFRRLRRTATFILLMAVLGKPIMIATQAFPKMQQAYEEVKRGNPKKGQEKFRDALDESFYSIFKETLKPVSLGIMLAYILEAPFTLRGQGKYMRHHITRYIAKLLHIKGEAKPVQKMFDVLKAPVYWGDRQANRLRQKLPVLGWIEEPNHTSELTRHLRQMMKR